MVAISWLLLYNTLLGKTPSKDKHYSHQVSKNNPINAQSSQTALEQITNKILNTTLELDATPQTVQPAIYSAYILGTSSAIIKRSSENSGYTAPNNFTWTAITLVRIMDPLAEWLINSTLTHWMYLTLTSSHSITSTGSDKQVHSPAKILSKWRTDPPTTNSKPPNKPELGTIIPQHVTTPGQGRQHKSIKTPIYNEQLFI